ncbi:MAG TPA: hypothetical protein VN778_01780, partial [Verrucomicrobiae bacterium]|nr:hypothetical protein [Verrucomicrobiae bacterium]
TVFHMIAIWTQEDHMPPIHVNEFAEGGVLVNFQRAHELAAAASTADMHGSRLCGFFGFFAKTTQIFHRCRTISYFNPFVNSRYLL